MKNDPSKRFIAIIIGGVAAFGFFLLAAIIAAFMHDAKAEEIRPHVFSPGMGDRMLLLALPGEATNATKAGDL